MKIVVAGGYDTKNLGDHAMLKVLVRDFSAKVSDLETVLLSRHPDKAFDKAYGVRSIHNLDYDTKEASLGHWFRGLNYGDDTEHLRIIRKELESADLLVIGGGRLLVDISLGLYRGPLPYYALLVTLARFFGLPVVIFGMTIISVDTEAGRELIRYIVSNSDAVMVREESSRLELERLGLMSERVQVLPDPALGLESIDRKEKGLEILRDEGIELKTRRCLAFSVRSIVTLWDGRAEQDGSSFIEALTKFADTLAETLEADILFIPQQTYCVDEKFEDDRQVAIAVREGMARKDLAHIIRGDYDVDETLALYQLSEMLVATRRHAMVFALTQGIPVVALSGDPNIEGFMQSVGGASEVVKLEDMNTPAATAKIKQIWGEREQRGEAIAEHIRELRSSVGDYSDTMVDIIASKV